MEHTSKELLEKFLKSLEGSKLYPPVNNYSLFTFGSEYNSQKYFADVFDKMSNYSLLVINDGSNTVLWIAEQVFIDCSREAFTKYLKDQSTIQKSLKRFYEHFDDVDAVYRKYTYDAIAKENMDVLCKEVTHTVDHIWRGNAWGHFSVLFDRDLCAQAIRECGYPVTKERLDTIWDRAVIPAFRSFDKVQEIFALDLLASGRNIDSIAEDCQYFLSSYKDTLPLSVVREKLHERFGHIGGIADAKSALQDIKDEEAHTQKERDVWLATLTPEERVVAEYCQIVMRTRDHRKNFFNKGLAFVWRVAERMFDEAGIDKKYIYHVLISKELVRGVDYLKSRKGEIEKRQDGYVAFVPYAGGVEIAYDSIDEVKKDIADQYVKSETQGASKNLKGQVGSRGKATGRVRIVLDARRSSHFNDGEVLVTGMTRPEYVPLMKKALAIVTDEGGITCHAAIVSRELGIPCVIGTKIATKILKDGDMVEVDAERGIVTILNKNE